MPVPNIISLVPGDNETVAARLFWVKAKYDFAVDGGAIGNINLLPDAAVPNGALVLHVLLNVKTIVTGGAGATLGIGVEAVSDAQTAVVVTGAPWSTTGWKVGTRTFTSSPSPLTANRNIVATIGANTLTAGVVEVLVCYLPPGL